MVEYEIIIKNIFNIFSKKLQCLTTQTETRILLEEGQQYYVCILWYCKVEYLFYPNSASGEQTEQTKRIININMHTLPANNIHPHCTQQ